MWIYTIFTSELSLLVGIPMWIIYRSKWIYICLDFTRLMLMYTSILYIHIYNYHLVPVILLGISILLLYIEYIYVKRVQPISREISKLIFIISHLSILNFLLFPIRQINRGETFVYKTIGIVLFVFHALTFLTFITIYIYYPDDRRMFGCYPYEWCHRTDFCEYKYGFCPAYTHEPLRDSEVCAVFSHDAIMPSQCRDIHVDLTKMQIFQRMEKPFLFFFLSQLAVFIAYFLLIPLDVNYYFSRMKSGYKRV